MSLPDWDDEERANELESLVGLPARASDYLRTHGWEALAPYREDGPVGIAGALRACAAVPGEHCMLQGVLNHQGITTAWEYRGVENLDEVLEALRRVRVDDSEMTEVYGVSWSATLSLVRMLSRVTSQECSKIAAVLEMREDTPTWKAAEQTLLRAQGGGESAAWASGYIFFWIKHAIWGSVAHVSGWETLDWVPHIATVAMKRWRVDAQPLPSWPRSSYDELCSPLVYALGKKLHPLD